MSTGLTAIQIAPAPRSTLRNSKQGPPCPECNCASTIRKGKRVILSNPDMLHSGILPHHTKWTRLFENLRYIVLVELHTYRGVFGSHLANVLRRLTRIARFYGSNPQYIYCSATIANPAELAAQLIASENGGP